MATNIFFNGRIISVPGAYSYTDASQLNQAGLSASGIVAVLGTSEGGIPVSAFLSTNDIPRFTQPNQAKYRSGNLLEGVNILFAPSADPAIPGGAQQVVALKVNPAIAASAQFAGASGPVLQLTAKDWGAFTSQINVNIANGTSQGKMLTIRFENTVEAVDNLGGSPVASLQYVPTATSWATMTAGVESTGSVHANATRSVAGLTGSIAAITSGPVTLSVIATAADSGKTVYVYGVDGSGNAQREDAVLVNGTYTTVKSFSTVYGVYATSALAGTVTVQQAATVLATLNSGTQSVGVALWSYGYVAGAPVTFVAASATTAKLLVEGLNSFGSTVRELLTLNGTTPVQTTQSYTQLTMLGMAQAPTGNAITVSALAAKSDGTVQTTVQKQSDFFNAKGAVVGGTSYGFVYTIQPSVATNAAALANTLDVSTADVSLVGGAVNLTNNLAAIVNWVNSNSQLVSASIVANAVGAPNNTGGAVFLQGGTEGSTTFQQWQNALNWLKRIRVNTIVPLTSDPAVHAAVDAHCVFMNGVGKSERDAFVGLANAAMTDVPSKTELKAQIQALNTRNLRCLAQTTRRYNTQGVLTEFPSPFTALLAAGMQAGTSVGTSLTYKYANTIGARQDASWNPIDDAEELINSGLLFMQRIDGVGHRWVRNVTAYLASNNIAYVEGSVNQAVNYSAYTFRTALEIAVGQKGFAGTINATRSVALGILGQLVDQQILTAYRNLNITLSVDVLTVSVDMAPVIPVNFVPITIHLINSSQSGTQKAA